MTQWDDGTELYEDLRSAAIVLCAYQNAHGSPASPNVKKVCDSNVSGLATNPKENVSCLALSAVLYWLWVGMFCRYLGSHSCMMMMLTSVLKIFVVLQPKYTIPFSWGPLLESLGFQLTRFEMCKHRLCEDQTLLTVVMQGSVTRWKM